MFKGLAQGWARFLCPRGMLRQPLQRNQSGSDRGALSYGYDAAGNLTNANAITCAIGCYRQIDRVAVTHQGEPPTGSTELF
jgi:hypothetical protein